jgi:hypothetical protein
MSFFMYVIWPMLTYWLGYGLGMWAGMTMPKDEP